MPIIKDIFKNFFNEEINTDEVDDKDKNRYHENQDKIDKWENEQEDQ